MIQRISEVDKNAPVLMVDIGNTATTVASWHENKLLAPVSFHTADESAWEEAYNAHLDDAPKKQFAATVVGSVVPDALQSICKFVAKRGKWEAHVVGETIELPMEVSVTDPKAIGVDRVCAAAAAFARLGTGCTVVDFGTAVTVDLVDDDGVLCGGAILPGLRMQLRALHQQTAVLPECEPGFPTLPYGRNTSEAIQSGVCRGLSGAVRGLIEGYATSLNRWPQVVATGGDATFMAPQCDFLDTLVEHLTLHGIALAYAKHVEEMGGV